MDKRKSARPAQPTAAEIVEEVVGCKWTVRILGCIRAGTLRPGAIRGRLRGLTTKVLNERLRKLVRLQLISRTAYPEVPPRVEYDLTSLGRRFVRLLDHIEALQEDLDRARVR
jgi:DNA-binding HxlR family transcriptional regulator